MKALLIRLAIFMAAALLSIAAQRSSLASSATWATNPTSSNWNTAANWVPNTVPNSTTDVATFSRSNVTEVINSDVIINLDSLVFSPDASQYTISALDNIELYGPGVVNNSGILQSFIVGAFFFKNSSAAGKMVSFTTTGGNFFFDNASSAGSASFDVASGDLQAHMFFNDNSSAENATINASASSVIEFFDSSTGGNSTVNVSSAAFVLFEGSNNAEHMTATCSGGAGAFSSQIDFEGFSSAGEGTFTTIGGSTSGEHGSFILFDNTATADNATFVINGGMGRGLSATALLFVDNTTAANANITANGGVGGSKGGMVNFEKASSGGTAGITLNGNAKLDITAHNPPGVTIGSLDGAGSVLLGGNTLTIGSNNQSTTFSGVIQGTGGVSKTGTGTLTLSGANSYSGGTTVSAGVLNVSNPISGTFSNLPDGGIVTINGNNFQASYEGGDGNDLTLTLVP